MQNSKFFLRRHASSAPLVPLPVRTLRDLRESSKRLCSLQGRQYGSRKLFPIDLMQQLIETKLNNHHQPRQPGA